MAGVIDTTYTFTSNDTITSSKMNNIIDETTFTSSAISGTTLQVAAGKLAVNSLGITSNEVASNAITTGKITDLSVTPEKLSSGGPAWTATYGSIPNFQISGDYDFYQTTERLGDGYSAFHFGSQSGSYINATIKRKSGVDGDFELINNGNGNISFQLTGTGKILFGSTPLGAHTGTAPIYGARAWGILDGDSFSTITAISAVRTGTTIRIRYDNHGFVTGDIVPIDFSGSTPSGEFLITREDNNYFLITSAGNGTTATTTWHVMNVISNGKGNIRSFLALPNGAGRYTVNFNIAMPSDQYSVVGSLQSPVGNPRIFTLSGARSVYGFGFYCESNGGSPTNIGEINISVFA